MSGDIRRPVGGEVTAVVRSYIHEVGAQGDRNINNRGHIEGHIEVSQVAIQDAIAGIGIGAFDLENEIFQLRIIR